MDIEELVFMVRFFSRLVGLFLLVADVQFFLQVFAEPIEYAKNKVWLVGWEIKCLWLFCQESDSFIKGVMLWL